MNTPKVTQYDIAAAKSASDLAATVTAKLAEGWELYGPMTATNLVPGHTNYLQPLIRRTQEPAAAA